MRRILGTALIAALTAALLSGCDVGLPSAEQTSKPSPTRSATPSPTPTPSATVRPAVLSTAGLGVLRMGSPVPSDAPVRWNASACSDVPDGIAGLWEATDAVTGSTSLSRPTPFGLLTRDGNRDAPIDLLQVWSSQYSTPSGLHVGSTEAEVRTALPKASVLRSELSNAYSVVSAGWRITLTVADAEGAVLGDDGTVQIISVYPASQPETSWWNTDVGAGCGA